MKKKITIGGITAIVSLLILCLTLIEKAESVISMLAQPSEVTVEREIKRVDLTKQITKKDSITTNPVIMQAR
jgi:hypothetical protein